MMRRISWMGVWMSVGGRMDECMWYHKVRGWRECAWTVWLKLKWLFNGVGGRRARD